MLLSMWPALSWLGHPENSAELRAPGWTRPVGLLVEKKGQELGRDRCWRVVGLWHLGEKREQVISREVVGWPWCLCMLAQ